MSGMDAGDVPSLSIVIKNADGVTVDFVLRDTPLIGTRIRSLKTLLREQYPAQPEEDSMKLVHSGRLLKDNELLTDVIQLQDLSVPPIFHLLVRECPSRSSSASVSRSNSNGSELTTPVAVQSETPARVSSSDRSWSGSSVNASGAQSVASSPVAASGGSTQRYGCCPHQHQSNSSQSPASSIAPSAVTPAAQTWSPYAVGAAAGAPAWAVTPTPLPAYPPMPVGIGMPFAGIGAQDPAACYEMLHKIYYEAYFHTYMAAMNAEESTMTPEACAAGAAANGAGWSSPAAVPPAGGHGAATRTDHTAGCVATGGDRAVEVGALNASAAAAAAVDVPEAGGPEFGAGEARHAAGAGQPRVHLHAGARGPLRQGMVRDDADGGRGGAGGAGREVGALRLAAKLLFIVFLLGQDAPRERLYTLCCIALCIFLHQVGLLQPPGWMQPRPPAAAGPAGMADLRADEVNNGPGDEPPAGGEAQDGDASGATGAAGGARGAGARPPAVEDRGLLADVGALIVAFFTSLFPVPLGHEPAHGLAN